MNFLTILGVTEILCSFKLVLEEKTGKEIPESSRLEFLEKVLANKGIADLPLLRKVLAIRQKSWEQSFCEVMDSFVSVEYASLAALTTILQW